MIPGNRTTEESASDEGPLVFIVDDDEAIRQSLTVLLATAGLRSRSFALAADFLAAVGPAERGCVLLDVRLPDMSGLEVQAAMAARKLPLPIIIMTAYADVPLAVRAMKAGAFDFVEKPFTDSALLECIGAALSREARRAGQDRTATPVAEALSRLTRRERDVLDLIIAGRQNKEIAYLLGISPRTVEIHRARVMEKMGARNLPHLVRMIVSPDTASRGQA
jgi:FixJ family two-component response regulator